MLSAKDNNWRVKSKPKIQHIKKEKPCRYFSVDGTCPRGEDCRFLHNPIDEMLEKMQISKENAETKEMENNGKLCQEANSNTLSDLKKEQRGKRNLKKKPKPKNTECFEPMTKPVDMRIVYDLRSVEKGVPLKPSKVSLTSRDVLLAPNVFADFGRGELYKKLEQEIRNCGIPEERLLKLWHGNDKLEGTHLIADDKTRWKQSCPTFEFVIERLKEYFTMKVQATRFNWYIDTSHWKPFHHDAAYLDESKAAVQNFTVAVSFGVTRDAAFEHASTKTVISMPQPDGCVYAFANHTNGIWRHGILQDTPVRNEGRISIIAWGWVDDIYQISV